MYGGARCVGCGHENTKSLSFDHINGGGSEHRKQIGNNLCRWIKRNDYPTGFQVLCMNCQWKKEFA